ncbi:MAG: guanine nucleotide-binding protein subunit gamma [Piptocephalis tieghemiana]|nr:MAG: guanine nucleotide-binding protein subunit gamma [Piptocephalis tieghemiana]
MSELKLKKLQETNARLRQQLEMPRIPVSDASASLVQYVQSTRDTLLPSIWGPLDKREDPYAPVGGGCTCTVM